MTTRLLKRRYVSNGFAVSIHYFTPDELSKGFFTVSLGYNEPRIEYTDNEYISTIIHEHMNINHVWKDMIMFTRAFPTWNRCFVSKEMYDDVYNEIITLRKRLKELSE